MVFNPEDGQNFGPHCRNCHKGSSGCGSCHSADAARNAILSKNSSNQIASIGTQNDSNTANNLYGATGPNTTNGFVASEGYAGSSAKSKYNLFLTSTNAANVTAQLFNTPLVVGEMMPGAGTGNGRLDTSTRHFGTFKTSQTVTWAADIRTSATVSGATCSDDGFSWPHRTLGWKMLKDDLFGLDFDGTTIAVGETRTYATVQLSAPAHDIDSVCLDCHNPTIWNATSGTDHVDDPNNAADNYDDELIMRGLP